MQPSSDLFMSDGASLNSKGGGGFAVTDYSLVTVLQVASNISVQSIVDPSYGPYRI